MQDSKKAGKIHKTQKKKKISYKKCLKFFALLAAFFLWITFLVRIKTRRREISCNFQRVRKGSSKAKYSENWWIFEAKAKRRTNISQFFLFHSLLRFDSIWIVNYKQWKERKKGRQFKRKSIKISFSRWAGEDFHGKKVSNSNNPRKSWKWVKKSKSD